MKGICACVCVFPVSNVHVGKRPEKNGRDTAIRGHLRPLRLQAAAGEAADAARGVGERSRGADLQVRARVAHQEGRAVPASQTSRERFWVPLFQNTVRVFDILILIVVCNYLLSYLRKFRYFSLL